MVNFVLLISLISSSEEINVDSILREYAKPILESKYDSVLVLSEVSIKWRGNDGKYYTANSGVKVTYEIGGQYIDVVADKNGLYYLVLPTTIGYVRCLEVSYDTLHIPTSGLGLDISGSAIFGLAFESGSLGQLRPSFEHVRETDLDTIYDWRIIWSDNPINVLEDFLTLHPDHPHASLAQTLLEDLKLYNTVKILIKDENLDSAKVLCSRHLENNSKSLLTGVVLAAVAIESAKKVFEQGDTLKTIGTLMDYIDLGHRLGIAGRMLNLVLLSAIKDGVGGVPFISFGEAKFGIEVATEVNSYFFERFLSEKQFFLFKYNAYRYVDEELLVNLCLDRLRKCHDSLAYEYLIKHYLYDNLDSAIKLGKSALKNGIKIKIFTVLNLGMCCYNNKKFEAAVYFFESIDFKYTIELLPYYVNSLIKIKQVNKAQKALKQALEFVADEVRILPSIYKSLIECAINLKFEKVVDSLYADANLKLNRRWLTDLRLKMADVYCESQEFNRALMVLNEAIADTTSVKVLEGFCKYYFRIGKYDSAELCLKKAVSIADSHQKVNAMKSLCDLYLKIGNKRKSDSMRHEIDIYKEKMRQKRRRRPVRRRR